MNTTETYDFQLTKILELFFDEPLIEYEIKNTSFGESDFREAVFLTLASGERYVLKFADNAFTFPDKIIVWMQCAKAYRKLGYYTPAILPSKTGDFPIVRYKDRDCVVYAEEFAKYQIADEIGKGITSVSYANDALIMTAKIAASRLDFSEYPSGFCLFEPFSPSDQMDEVMDNALEWKRHAETLPAEYQPQVKRIWNRWIENRTALETIYKELPTSVFQADLNTSNILLDEQGCFAGVFDFNLCGRDVFLNYLFREIFCGDNKDELQRIFTALQTVSPYYHFSDLEKEAAPLLYRCLKPLWYTRIQQLKEAGTDCAAIQARLDQTEWMQTAEIDFSLYMNP